MLFSRAQVFYFCPKKTLNHETQNKQQISLFQPFEQIRQSNKQIRQAVGISVTKFAPVKKQSTVYEETTTTKIAIVTPKTEEEKKEEEITEIIKVVAISVSVVALSVGIYFILLKLGVFSML